MYHYPHKWFKRNNINLRLSHVGLLFDSIFARELNQLADPSSMQARFQFPWATHLVDAKESVIGFAPVQTRRAKKEPAVSGAAVVPATRASKAIDVSFMLRFIGVISWLPWPFTKEVLYTDLINYSLCFPPN